MGSYGWIAQRPDHRDHIFNLEEHIYQSAQLPTKIDLWPHVPPIWKQLDIGSCTAHGALRGFLTEAIKQGISIPMLSRLMQYFDTRALENTTATDAGGQVRDAIKVLATQGCCPESEWAYDTSKFAEKPPARCYTDALQYMSLKYQRIQIGLPGSPIRTALANGLAVVFGFSVPSYFESQSWNPATQPLPVPNHSQGFIGGHCVAITGYDFTCTNHPRPYFICDNSWDVTWGGPWDGPSCTGGRFAMDWDWFNPTVGLATDFWVIQAVK